MNRKNRTSTGFISLIFLMLLALGTFSSCMSSPGTEAVSEEELHNTLWLSPICGMSAEGKYGKEGFFLAEDGSLLFVNIFSMTGDRWSVEGDELMLYSHTRRYPEPEAAVYPIRRIDGHVSINALEEESEVLPPSARKITADIPEGRWQLSEILNPDNAQPNTEQSAYIEIIEEDGSVSIHGNGGVNIFRAALDFDGFKWTSGPYMRTLMAGPGLEYEDLFMTALDRVNRYLTAEDYLFLYDETELILVLRRAQD